MRNIETYLRETLIPAMGYPGRDFECRIPDTGTRTRVVHVIVHDGPDCYLKLFDNFEKFVRAKYVLQFFSRRGLPAPELMTHSYLGRLRPGMRSYYFVERAVPGHLFGDMDDKESGIRKIARTLAQVHDVTRSRWGYLIAPRRGDYFNYYFKRARRRISELKKYTPAFGDNAARKLETYLLGWRECIGSREVFELIHGRVNRDNFVINDRAVIIDLGTASFGHFAYDLIRAVHRFCEGDDRLEQLFLESYFAASVHVTPADYESVYSFYHVDYHLAQSNSIVRHMKKETHGDSSVDPRLAGFERHFNEMLQLLETDA